MEELFGHVGLKASGGKEARFSRVRVANFEETTFQLGSKTD
jgi:hypothetical protein